MSKLICPQCQKKRNFEGSSLSKQLEFAGIKPSNKNIKAYAKIEKWACSHCLKKGKATLPNYKKQAYGLHGPLSSYVDIAKICTNCQQSFIFSAKEQRYWYEQLKFNLKSSPKNCAPCRRQLREATSTKKKLVEEITCLLAVKKPTIGALERLQEIYHTLGYEDRQTAIAKQLKNARKKS